MGEHGRLHKINLQSSASRRVGTQNILISTDRSVSNTHHTYLSKTGADYFYVKNLKINVHFGKYLFVEDKVHFCSSTPLPWRRPRHLQASHLHFHSLGLTFDMVLPYRKDS